MSLAAESPVHSSSSSDDFAAALEVDLEMNNSSSSSSTSSNKSLGRDSYDAGSGEDEYADLKEATNKEGGQEADEEGQEADEEGHGRTKRCKIEDIGVTSGNYSAIVNNLPSQRECSHPGLYKGLCVNCGQPIEDDGSGVAFGYIREGLTVRPTEIQRLREIDLKNLFHKKKLILVLDLDHTLLNSTRYADISSEEDLLLRKIDPMHGDPKRSLFKLDSMHLLTKLRPYVHTFLSEASNMYEMYIYTMAERSYALEIAKILDPNEVYFHSKVICQSDCTQRYQKGLDVVLGAENTVVILDDTEAVWQKHKQNLILMERYHYFSSSSRQFNSNFKPLLLAKEDESETDGILYSILAVLKRVHQLFYDTVADNNLKGSDVRLVLRTVRQEILQGCKLVFSHIFPSESRGEDHRIWKMCEQLGAKCYTDVDPSITHIISNDGGTMKSRWAVQNEKFLVNPGWVEGAYFLWRRMQEKDYPVSTPKVLKPPKIESAQAE